MTDTCFNFPPAGPINEDAGSGQESARPPETASVGLGLMDLAKISDFLVSTSNIAISRLKRLQKLTFCSSCWTVHTVHRKVFIDLVGFTHRNDQIGRIDSHFFFIKKIMSFYWYYRTQKLPRRDLKKVQRIFWTWCHLKLHILGNWSILFNCLHSQPYLLVYITFLDTMILLRVKTGPPA